MQRIRISDLESGQAFNESLFSLTGQKLLNAGVVLRENHISAIRRAGAVEVVAAESVDDLVEAGLLDKLDRGHLAVGQKAQRGVVSRAGHVIVEAGQEIEEHHLDAIAAGGTSFSSKAEQSMQRRERILLGDSLLQELIDELPTIELRVKPETGRSWLAEHDAPGWPTPVELAFSREASVESLRQSFARIEAGITLFVSAFDGVLDDLTSRLENHPTRFTQLALLCPRREDYLPDHAYTVAVLSMAMAAQMRWSRADVRRVGLAGLLFDLGMLLIPERIRTGACELTDIDRSRVQRHPVFSLAMISCIEGVEPAIRLAALQHHERENGTGYPRNTRGDHLCDLARIVAVADAFAATSEPRSYRRQKLPYIAMEESLRAASTSQFWKPAVRALVQAAGLFPVGSYVRLSDGRNAHIIASNFKQLDRPTVQPLDVEGKPKGPAVDLASVATTALSVVRPIPGAVG